MMNGWLLLCCPILQVGHYQTTINIHIGVVNETFVTGGFNFAGSN